MLEKFSTEAQQIISKAESFAFDFKHTEICPCHLLLAILDDDSLFVTKELKKKNVDYHYVYKKIKDSYKVSDSILFMEYKNEFKKILQKSTEYAKDAQENKISTHTLQIAFLLNLDGFCMSLLNDKHINSYEIAGVYLHKINKKSELDKISDLHDLSKDIPEPYVERKDDFQKLYIALKRRNKPNALLVGEPGVGKTAMVRELAQRIKRKEISGLENKKIYELDLASVVGGTKYRGEFEEKLKKIIQKVIDDGNAILFIDEIHNIIRAGGAEGAIDASNILKPYLSRGLIQIIGATTKDEYYQIFLKDKALARRFQVIFMNPTSKKETKEILKAFLPTFEDFYHITIDESLLDYIIFLADSYLPTLSFPDKAIDILDNSCVLSKKKLSKSSIDEVIENYYHISLKKTDIAGDLKKELEKELIGQETAIENIYSIFKRIDQRLYDRRRPILSLLISGPSGVGKTKASQIISSFYYPQSEILSLDMSFYKDYSSLYRLIGFKEDKEMQPGVLSQFILEHPHSLLLLENIDHASSDIHRLFTNIINQGYFYDSNRHKIDCHHVMFIFVATMESSSQSFGLFNENKIENIRILPEFFLRSLDDMICFNHISEQSIRSDILFHIQKNYLSSNEQSFEFQEDNFICDKDSLYQYGFHYLNKEIGKYIKKKQKIKESSK